MTWGTISTTLANYYINRKRMFITGRFTGTTGGSANPVLTFTLPFASATALGTSCVVWTAGSDTTGELYVGTNSTASFGRINASAATNFDLGANTGLLYGQLSYAI